MPESPFSAPSVEAMNSLLPGFEFTALISSSSLGAVYFANQRSLDRQVAIKILAPELGTQDAFQSRARAAAGLKHPNLISIFDSGTVGGIPFLVMEFVPGKSLARSTKGKIVDFAQAMVLIEGICEGLACAHANGIFHGFLNPTNVLLNQKAEPKIGNFGLQESTQADASDDSAASYAAPEVLADSGSATAQSDIYSIAAIFYELITGRPHGPDARPPSEISKCKPEIDVVVRRATDPDPANRMADVAAFQSALKKAASAGGLVKLQAAAPAVVATPETPVSGRKAGSVKAGFDWKLVRNLAIIAGLLYGIHLTWQLSGMMRVKREKQNKEILAKQAAEKERAIAEAARKRAIELAINPVSPGSKPELPDVPNHTVSPRESLDDLRSSLASGSRSEMPVGSVKKGDSDYFFVSEPMTWADAALFAEEHGAHLAVPDSVADPAWLLGEVAKGESAWIGVARGVGNPWVSVAGSVWVAPAEPSGAGPHLTVASGGLVASDGGSSQKPFIIQWHRDGSNPGKFSLQLAATARSLSQPNPVFPAGTVAFGDHSYLFVPQPVSWEAAGRLAESAGGNLAVISDPGELANVKAMTQSLKAEDGIWIGGSLEGSLWAWVTGEPWSANDWAADASATDEGLALCVMPGKGWDGRDRTEEASGFIIEWSADGKSGGAKPAAPVEDATALLARAKEVVVTADKKRNDALAANVKKLSWDIDSYVRGLNRSGQAQYGPSAGLIKACSDGNRLVVESLRSDQIVYSAEMLKLANYHVDKQAEIDKQFTDSLSTIRDAFVVKLTELKAKVQGAGQPKLVEEIEESIEAAADLDGWLESMGMEGGSDAGE